MMWTSHSMRIFKKLSEKANYRDAPEFKNVMMSVVCVCFFYLKMFNNLQWITLPMSFALLLHRILLRLFSGLGNNCSLRFVCLCVNVCVCVWCVVCVSVQFHNLPVSYTLAITKQLEQRNYQE